MDPADTNPRGEVNHNLIRHRRGRRDGARAVAQGPKSNRAQEGEKNFHSSAQSCSCGWWWLQSLEWELNPGGNLSLLSQSCWQSPWQTRGGLRLLRSDGFLSLPAQTSRPPHPPRGWQFIVMQQHGSPKSLPFKLQFFITHCQNHPDPATIPPTCSPPPVLPGKLSPGDKSDLFACAGANWEVSASGGLQRLGRCCWYPNLCHLNVNTKCCPTHSIQGFLPTPHQAQKTDEGAANGALPGPISRDLGSIQALLGVTEKP